MTGTETERSFVLLAEGLAARLRDILMTQRRWDGFVHDPEGGGPQLLPPPDETDRLAEEMILRALRVATDPINSAILRRLAREDRVALTSLMEQTGLSRIALLETINDLSQVGLASYAVDTREVGATSAAIGFAGLLDAVREQLARIMGERLEPGRR